MLDKDTILVFLELGNNVPILGKTKHDCKGWVEIVDRNYRLHIVSKTTDKEIAFFNLDLKDVDKMVSQYWGTPVFERKRFLKSEISQENEILYSLGILKENIEAITRDKLKALIQQYADQGIDEETIKRIIWDSDFQLSLDKLLKVTI